jgi:hypothetical protein
MFHAKYISSSSFVFLQEDFFKIFEKKNLSVAMATTVRHGI